MQVRTRFAPSPTGSLHVGGARTALFNWLFARQHHGEFILRIEDTDFERSTTASAQGIIESLQWLGLNWDETPYFQSQRTAIYLEHLHRLQAQGAIYPAFESKEELVAMRQRAMAAKCNPIYDRAALKLSAAEINLKMDAGEEFVWRFKVPTGEYTKVPELLMADANYQIRNETIGDFIITRPGTKNKPGMPLYNFVCVVDDALMHISHVIRGVEHLPNAAKQVLLYQALGYALPLFVHLPLIMKNGKKMSKRDPNIEEKFPVSVLERRDLGYLPETTLNHLALLGWSSATGEEILSVDRLIAEFDLARLSKSNANFDEDKYLFLNAYYLRNLDDAVLLAKVMPYLLKKNADIGKSDKIWLEKLVAAEKGRCKLLCEFPEALDYFFVRPKQYAAAAVEKIFKKDGPFAVKILTATIHKLTAVDNFDSNNIDTALHHTLHESNIAFSKYGPMVRLALTGRTQSPTLSSIIVSLGKDETIYRLQAAIQFIQHFVKPA